MPRVYSRQVEVPTVDVLDWELIDEVVDLFTERGKAEASLSISARDQRGEYTEDSMAAFRAAAEGHNEDPRQITVALHGDFRHAPNTHFQLWWSEPRNRYHRGGVFESLDEADVVYLAERCDDALRRANERYLTRIRADTPSVTDRIRAFFYNPWIVTVGGGLVLAGLIALIVSLAH